LKPKYSKGKGSIQEHEGQTGWFKELENEKAFEEWMNDGNVVKVSHDQYKEQTTQWKAIFTMEELKTFFYREFIK
jgi:hypothetical protein